MSRKPPPSSSTTSHTRLPSSSTHPALTRAPSTSNLTFMPPPTSRAPTTRPGSAMSSSTTRSTSRQGQGGEDGEVVSGSVAGSRAGSPTGGRGGAKRTVSGEKKLAKNGSGNGNGEKIGEDGEMNIQVVVRCRGRSPMEISQRTPIICTTTSALSSSLTIETTHSSSSHHSIAGQGLPITTLPYSERAPISKTYAFDRVFGPEADQNMVYREVVEGMLDEVLEGYNCTIFAYGQTGTGKTYTMAGDLSLTPLGKPSAEAGIIPRVLHRLFSLLESTPNSEFSVKASYIELYNEELRDLLAADFHQPVALGGPTSSSGIGGGGHGPGGLKIYEDGKNKGGVMIQGLEETGIRNAKEGLGLLMKGSQRRQVAETKMNTESSRSHSIFSLTVHIKESSLTGGEDLLKVGKLNLVDLAGSEAIGRSGAENKRAREAGMINQSLLTLGRVISALVEKASYIPYRDSKLTRLLQDSLGGRTKTCIVATVSPTRSNMEETLSTLDYAIRAKTIRNKPEINQRLTKGALIKEYVSEIERLKSDLMASHEKNGIYFSADTWAEMTAENEETKNQLADVKQRADALDLKHKTLSAEFEANMVVLVGTREELEGARREGEELRQGIEGLKREVEGLETAVEEEKWVGEVYMKGEERIDGIARGLKGTVSESVKDVGGLFAKIARKTDVLASNTDSTSQYNVGLNSLADRLHRDIDGLKEVQSSFGKTLQGELEAFAKRGAETLEQDKIFLSEKLVVFNTQMDMLRSHLESADNVQGESFATLSAQQQEVQQSLIDWMDRLRESQLLHNVQVKQQQESHMHEVQASIELIADTLDILVDAAVEQTTTQTKSADARQVMRQAAHDDEVARLKAQNENLARMLVAEQETSTRLKNDMISQFTQMINGYSSGQAERLQSVFSQLQNTNEDAVNAAGQSLERYDVEAAESSGKVDQYLRDLDDIRRSNANHRDDARKVIGATTSDLHMSLGSADEILMAEIKQQKGRSTQGLTVMGNDIHNIRMATGASTATSYSHLEALKSGVGSSLDAAKDRLAVAKEDIKVVSSAVLTAHAKSEPIFAQHVTLAQSQLSDLKSLHSNFVTSLREDVSTGTTPRKRAWNVPSSWSKSQPKDVLLKRFRERADGERAEEEGVVYENIGDESASAGPSKLASSSGSNQTADDLYTPLTSPTTATPPTTTPTNDIQPENIALPADEPEQENVPPVNSGWNDVSDTPFIPEVAVKPLPLPSNSALNGSVLGKSQSRTGGGRGIPQPVRGLSSGLMESGLPVAGQRRKGGARV